MTTRAATVWTPVGTYRVLASVAPTSDKGLYVNVSSAVAPRYAPLRHTKSAGLRGHHIAPRGPMSLGRDDTAFQHALQGVTNRATHLEIDAKLFGT